MAYRPRSSNTQRSFASYNKSSAGFNSANDNDLSLVPHPAPYAPLPPLSSFTPGVFLGMEGKLVYGPSFVIAYVSTVGFLLGRFHSIGCL